MDERTAYTMMNLMEGVVQFGTVYDCVTSMD